MGGFSSSRASNAQVKENLRRKIKYNIAYGSLINIPLSFTMTGLSRGLEWFSQRNLTRILYLFRHRLFFQFCSDSNIFTVFTSIWKILARCLPLDQVIHIENVFKALVDLGFIKLLLGNELLNLGGIFGKIGGVQ